MRKCVEFFLKVEKDLLSGMSSVHVRLKNDKNDSPGPVFTVCVVEGFQLVFTSDTYSDLKKEANVFSRLGQAKREKIIAVEQNGGKTSSLVMHSNWMHPQRCLCT